MGQARKCGAAHCAPGKPGSTDAAPSGGPKFDGPDGRPCHATANTVLGLVKTILEERAQANGGQLGVIEIRQVIGQFMEAPGRLKSFYDENREACFAAWAPSSPAAGLEAEFAAKLKALTDGDPGALTLGRLQLVGLQAVRERLGERWPSVVEQVRALTETILRKRLTKDDTFLFEPNGDVVVCFGNLVGAEAWFKATSIAREIRDHLLGCEGESVLDDFAMEPESLAEASEVKADVHELPAPLSDAEGEGDVVAMVLWKLKEAERSMRHRAQDLLEQLERRWQVKLRAVNAAAGIPARFAMADSDVETRRALGRLLPMVRDDPQQLVQVDLLAIAAAADFLGQGGVPDGTLLAVPLHCASMVDGAAYQQLAATCGKLAPEFRNRLILVLDGIPADLSPAGLSEVLRRLRAFARLQAIKLKAPRLDQQHLQAAPTALVLIDHAPALAHLRRRPLEVKRFLADVKANGSRPLVDRVPPGESVEPLIDAGFEFWSQSADDKGPR